MRALLVGFAILLGSCYGPTIRDGQYRCVASDICPDGYACNRCGSCVKKGTEGNACTMCQFPDDEGLSCWVCGDINALPGLPSRMEIAAKGTCKSGVCEVPPKPSDTKACPRMKCCFERGNPICVDGNTCP